MILQVYNRKKLLNKHMVIQTAVANSTLLILSPVILGILLKQPL